MDRPAIPEPIKRAVRQKCYFGCVICGSPFFQYDHLEEWKHVREHAVLNLVLLCPNHHAAKTSGHLSKVRIKEALLTPFNKGRRYTSGYQVQPARTVRVVVGSYEVRWRGSKENPIHYVLWVNGSYFFALHMDDDWLSVSLMIPGEDGRPALKVVKGEVVVNTETWDYTYIASRIQVRSRLGDVLLDLALQDDLVEVRRGSFADLNGDGFVVQDNAVYTVLAGRVIGITKGGLSSESYAGAFGFYNSDHCPLDRIVRGFAVFRSVGTRPTA